MGLLCVPTLLVCIEVPLDIYYSLDFNLKNIFKTNWGQCMHEVSNSLLKVFVTKVCRVH